MGTPLHEIVPGAECLKWGVPAETPETMYCLFWDVMKGDAPAAAEPPNIHIFKMDQEPGIPCQWFFRNDAFGWQTRLGIDAAETWLHLRDTTPQQNLFFAHTKAVSPPVEYEVFTNIYVGAFGNEAYGGFGTIFWFEGISEIAAGFGFDDWDDVMVEVFPVDPEYFVVKFCSKRLGVNVSMKLFR